MRAAKGHGTIAPWALWLLSLCTSLLVVTGEPCPPAPDHFVFIETYTSTTPDSACLRNEPGAEFSPDGRARACLANPLCVAFTFDMMWSCQKLQTLGHIVVRNTSVPPGDVCYGLYVRTGLRCPHPDGTALSCTSGSIFLIVNGTARNFPNPHVYRSWGSPLPTVKGLKGGGCSRPGVPINGCDMGLVMGYKVVRLSANANLTTLASEYVAVPNTHYPGSNMEHFKNTTTEGCLRLCLERAPVCVMYEIGTSAVYVGDCWLKHSVPASYVQYKGITSYVPLTVKRPVVVVPSGSTVTEAALYDSASFFSLPDTHLPGGNIGLLKNTGPDACEKACKAKTGCVMFESGSKKSVYPRYCWLKSRVPQSHVHIKGVTAYVPFGFSIQSLHTDLMSTNRTFTPMANTHYPFNNLRLLRNITAHACESVCVHQTPGCVMFEFGSDTSAYPQHCWLKSGITDIPYIMEGVTAYIPTGATVMRPHPGVVSFNKSVLPSCSGEDAVCSSVAARFKAHAVLSFCEEEEYQAMCPCTCQGTLVLRYNYTLPWRLRNVALGGIMPTMPMRKLHQLLRGTGGSGTLRVAVIAAPYSESRFTDASRSILLPSWISIVEDVLKASLPRLQVVTHVGTVGVSRPYQAAICLDTLLDDRQFDLIFVEYNANLADRLHHPTASAKTMEYSRDFELLLRKLMHMSNHPQVVLLQALLPPFHWNRTLHFHSHPDEGLGMLASYYELPMLSMRNALWHLQAHDMTGFRVEDLRLSDGHYYNLRGVRYMAEMVLHFLQEAVVTVRELEHHGDERIGHLDNAPDPLPFGVIEKLDKVWMLDNPYVLPPMNPGLEVPITWLCAPLDLDAPEMSAIRSVEVKSSTEDWSLAKDDGQRRRYGYYTNATGAEGVTLNLTWAPPPKQWNSLDHSARRVTIMLGYLVSHDPRMGSAHLSCVQGCACAARLVSGHWDEVQSVRHVESLAVENPEFGSCTVQVRIERGPLGGTRFKVVGMFVVEATRGYKSKGVWQQHQQTQSNTNKAMRRLLRVSGNT